MASTNIKTAAPLAAFPDNYIGLTRKTNPTVQQMQLIQQYNSKIASGDAAGAAAIITANPTLVNCEFSPTDFNTMIDEIKAVEIFFNEQVRDFILQKQNEITTFVNNKKTEMTNFVNQKETALTNLVNEKTTFITNLVDDAEETITEYAQNAYSIDDTTPSESNVYSSAKVESIIAESSESLPGVVRQVAKMNNIINKELATATASSGDNKWIAANGLYTQTIKFTGYNGDAITVNDMPEIFFDSSAQTTQANLEAYAEQCGYINKIETIAGGIKATAWAKPTMVIKLIIKGV